MRATFRAKKYLVLRKAALDACDALDGVKDGVIEDPTRCKFDPSAVDLTAPQREMARKMYVGPTGMFPGVEPGSELGWSMLAGPHPMSLAVEVYKFIILEDPNWDYRTFDAKRDIARA